MICLGINYRDSSTLRVLSSARKARNRSWGWLVNEEQYRRAGGRQGRMPLPQDLCAEAEPPGRARREVLDEDVGPFDNAGQYLFGPVLLEIQGQRLLGAVEPDEVACKALYGSVVSAGEVPHFWTFDLYDARAEVGELAGGEGGGDCLL